MNRESENENEESKGERTMARKEYFEVLLDYAGLSKIALAEGESQSNFEALLVRVFGSANLKIAEYAKGVYKTDVARPLSGMSKYEGKDTYIKKVCCVIEERIKALLNPSVNTSQPTFDAWHKKTCEEICRESEVLQLKRKKRDGSYETIKFCYGSAQKWLNMTLKNLLISEYEGMESVKEYMHCPVDSYMLDAVIGEEILSSNELPKKENGKENKSWSQWTPDEYDKFQTALRNALNGKCPIEWEMCVWPIYKKKR